MLSVRLLGTVELSWRDRRLGAFPTEKSKSLFSYLLLNQRRRHPRDVVASKLWPDRSGPAGRSCLRTELWRVRRVVEPAAVEDGTYLRVSPKRVGFNASSKHWLDVRELEARLEPLLSTTRVGSSEEEAKAVQEAVELYEGDLLEGMRDEWMVFERERLRELFLNGLEWLTRYHEQRGCWSAAILCAKRLVNADPLREHVHRRLIRYQYARGDRAAAIRQFQRCRRLLRQELDVDPMEETRELHRRIVEQRALSEGHAKPRQPDRKGGDGAAPAALDSCSADSADPQEIGGRGAAEPVVEMALEHLSAAADHLSSVSDLVHRAQEELEESESD